MSQVCIIDEYLKAPAHPLRQTGGCRSIIKPMHGPKVPLVTVYTVVRNGKDTLSQTMMSVLSQSYPNIEYVVVDGASTDGTLDLLKQFDDKIDMWISEPDHGPCDAANKAISLSRGVYTFWLAADDWIDPDFIETAVQLLLKSEVEFVFGDMVMYKNAKLVAVYKGNGDYRKLLMSGDPHFNYPSMVVKRQCFQEIGLLDTNYRIINDYEWTMRLLLHGGKGLYSSSVLVHREVGGLGESHPFRSIMEHIRISRQYELPVTRAVVSHLYYFVRGGIGRLARLLLPGIIYTKFKRCA